MKKLVRLVKSSNGCVLKQHANLRSLKLNKIGDSVIVDYSPSIIGRIKKIQHLVVVEDL